MNARIRAHIRDTDRITRLANIAGSCMRRARDLSRTGRLALAYGGKGTNHAMRCFQAERRALQRASRLIEKVTASVRAAAAVALAEELVASKPGWRRIWDSLWFADSAPQRQP